MNAPDLPTSEFLDETEVKRLTGRPTRRKQIEALIEMGVQHIVNSTGSPVVPRAQFRVPSAQAEHQEPDWSSL